MHIYMCTNACKCVCVSDLPVPSHITKVTRVDGMAYPWFTCDVKDLICSAVDRVGWHRMPTRSCPPPKGAVSPVSVPMVGHATHYHGSLWVCVFRPLPGIRATLNSASPLPAPVESVEAPVDFLLVVCLYLRAHLSSLTSYLKS